jgi:uncharacterized membrane protein YbhN (UPF0104 family)
MLPLSISNRDDHPVLRGPLAIVSSSGSPAAPARRRRPSARAPLLRRSDRLRDLSEHVSRHTNRDGRKAAIVAWFYLFACWSVRAFGSAALLSALGLSFSPQAALAVICLSAAAGVIPITSGGAVVNAGAAAAILLTSGVGKDIAINFSLASGLLLVMSAVTASAIGVSVSLAASARAPQPGPERTETAAPARRSSALRQVRAGSCVARCVS